MADFDVHSFDIAKFDSILAKGLSRGLGEPDLQMCIEAAICQTLDLPHGDDPGCVTESVRAFKIRLNDAAWPTPEDRATGLRALGLAQLGSKGVVDGREFSTRMAEKTTRQLLPLLFRELANGRQSWIDAADRCGKDGTREAAYAAGNAAGDAYAVAEAAYAAGDAAAPGAYAASGNAAAHAAHAAHAAGDAAAPFRRLFYLQLSASLALETLRELNSPGIALLGKE